MNKLEYMLTGYRAEGDRCQALEAGFDYYLTQSVDLVRLQSVLKKSCAA